MHSATQALSLISPGTVYAQTDAQGSTAYFVVLSRARDYVQSMRIPGGWNTAETLAMGRPWIAVGDDCAIYWRTLGDSIRALSMPEYRRAMLAEKRWNSAV